MNLQFKLKDVLEVDLYYGFYEIFVVGGFDVQANPDFFVEILDLKTNDSILLTEKSFKTRDYKNRKRVVKFFTFQITNKSKFKISVHNYEDLTVYHSMIGANRFSIFNLLDILGVAKRNPIPLENIEILLIS